MCRHSYTLYNTCLHIFWEIIPDNVVGLGIEVLQTCRPVQGLVVPGPADVGLVEDADAIDGGEGEQAVGDPGGKGGEHHLPDEKGSVGEQSWSKSQELSQPVNVGSFLRIVSSCPPDLSSPPTVVVTIL